MACRMDGRDAESGCTHQSPTTSVRSSSHSSAPASPPSSSRTSAAVASPVQLPHPAHEQHLALVLLVDDGLPAAGDLEEEDAEAVDVGPGGGSAGHGTLGVYVAPGAGDHGGVRVAGVADEACEAEVAQLGVERRVQHQCITLLGLMSRCTTHCSHSW